MTKGCSAETMAPLRSTVTVTWYWPGRRLFGGKNKRGIEDVTFDAGGGEMLHENTGTERVSPKQVENLNRVLKSIVMSEVYLIKSRGTNWMSGTAF
jgi:hypothetical protein